MNSALARCNNSANAAGRGPRSGPGESESDIAMLVIDLSPPTPYGVSTTESRHFAHNRVKKVDRAQGGAVHKTGPALHWNVDVAAKRFGNGRPVAPPSDGAVVYPRAYVSKLCGR